MEVTVSEQITRISQEILRSNEFIFGWLFGFYENEEKNGKKQPVVLSTQLCTNYLSNVRVQLSKEQRKNQKYNYSLPDIYRDLTEKKAFLPGGIDLIGFWFSYQSLEGDEKESQKIILSLLEEGKNQLENSKEKQIVDEISELFLTNDNQRTNLIFSFPIKNQDKDSVEEAENNFEPALLQPKLYFLRDKQFGEITKLQTENKEVLHEKLEKERNTLIYIDLSPFNFSYFYADNINDINEKEKQLEKVIKDTFSNPNFIQLNNDKNPVRLIQLNQNNQEQTFSQLLKPITIDNTGEDEEEEEEIIIIDKSKKKKQGAKNKGKKNAKSNKNNNNNNKNMILEDEVEISPSFFTLPQFTSQSILYFDFSSQIDSSLLTFQLLSQNSSIKKESANIQMLYYCKDTNNVELILKKLTQRTISTIKLFFLHYFSYESVDQVYVAKQMIFFPPFIPHFIHPIFINEENALPDSNLEERKKYHKQFLLPFNRPIFKSANSVSFQFDPSFSKKTSKLRNVHVKLPASGVVGGTKYLVDGNYDYYHYRQDNFDDEGWGCAYRSMQTICSWLRYQSYTSKDDPSHYDIQQNLVDLGDKDKVFLRSRQWIGAVEISLCLNTIYDIDCKIEFCNSGENIKDAARVIKNHFLTNGSPIMIGGGVLAYTLLGIDWNESTGDIKFLILDPHYVGPENLNIIQSKGWCGWKDIKLFRKDAYYNLCMPQRPQMY